MSQQGERPAAHEDDWWRRLYDDSAPDTGASHAADSLDDRFDSASDAVRSGAGETYEAAPAVPGPRAVPPAVQAAGAPPGPPPEVLVRAPWEPQAGPSRPRTFSPPAPVPAPEPPPAEAAEPPLPDRPFVPPPPPPPPPSTDPRLAPDGPVPPLPRRPVTERQEPERPGTGNPAAPAPAAEPPAPRPPAGHVGARPPTYEAEPTALPATDPHALDRLVPDTVLDGARYGTYTLRAASARGDSARFRGEPRRDALLTARFGSAESALVLVAVAAGGARGAEGAHPAASDACHWIGEAVGRSHARLSDDIRAGRRGDLKSGLQRLTDRSYGKLRARAAELGLEPHAYTAGLRCLLLSADPDCRTRVFFGIGAGGLFRLRDGSWQDLEPAAARPGALTGEPVAGSGSMAPESGPGGDRLTMDLGITTAPGPYVEDPIPPPAEPFRFRASVARPGDTLLLCSTGLSEPLRGEPALAEELAERWTPAEAPGLGAFLADTQLRVAGYADDRTAVGVWEA
ncbi:protein phosphatase 2C domain-containing protein [Streptomyces sp. NBC_00876]|uniref:protein phosphatase 2C domain-containing protein n=1 Tax=Streptomyces sp. NBC_00876 TaxID=2975853 RepID=UPI00386A1350|nr:protein phosphatase 2C domain-containing protein [Streptomyces sp. NBC_00876]